MTDERYALWALVRAIDVSVLPDGDLDPILNGALERAKALLGDDYQQDVEEEAELEPGEIVVEIAVTE